MQAVLKHKSESLFLNTNGKEKGKTIQLGSLLEAKVFFFETDLINEDSKSIKRVVENPGIIKRLNDLGYDANEFEFVEVKITLV